jgi:predicted ATPase/class 3 adenylate cyclase
MKCQRCGASNAIGNRFCGSCGAPLTASGVAGRVGTAARQAALSQLTRELRWVSVLFVDLADYTALTHSWDAGDIRDMLAAYFDLARSIVGRYGGEVAKFIGDAVVAVWGSQTIREDDAERSVRAGLDVVDAVARFGIDHGWSDLVARGGVVTGRVALLPGADEGLVAGDIVNLASRIQSVAAPGSVLVDNVTMRATRGAVAYASTGDHQLKGLPGRMRLWSALRVLGSGRDGQRQDGLTTSFVGRDREMGRLTSLFRETAASRQARLVAVTGQAGIGKSRLVAEFRTYVAGRVPSVAWHRGRCPSYGDGLAFWALSEMLRGLLGLEEDENGAAARARLTEQLPQWIPADDEREFVEPRLAVLLEAADRDFTRQELFAAWRLFFERLSDIQPLVLLFEDLQWAGRELLDFLSYLLDWSAERPLFLLAPVRTRDDHDHPSLLDGRPRTNEIRLDPLPADVIERILDDLVSGLPDALKQRVAAYSGGVPLFAVETVGSLIDRGLVVYDRDSRTLLGEVDDLEVPASLTALVAARLDQLAPAQRNLVKGLAVLGSTFSRLSIAAVADGPDAEVDQVLQALVGKGILGVVSGTGGLGGVEYQFVQSMVGTVASDLLSRRERKVRHLAVADRLERMARNQDPDLAELVAAHYHDAYRASLRDSDRADIRRRAALAYERAASRVSSLGSAARAGRYYETAANLAEDEALRLRLTEEAAQASFVSGQYEKSLGLYERALEAHRSAQSEVAIARLGPPFARTLKVLGRVAEGMSVLHAAIEVLTEHEEVESLAEAHAVLAERFAFSLDEEEVARHTERALELATAAGSPDVLCKALNARGWLLQRQHRAQDAAATFAELVEVARTHDLPLAELLGRGNLADVQSQADLPGAESGHLAAMELAERLGDIGNLAVSLSNLAFHYLYAGHWDRTENYAGRAAESMKITELQNFGHFPLLMLAVMRRDTETARTHLRPLQSWADDDDAQSRDSYLIGDAAVASIEGPPEEAVILATKAARIAYESNGLMSESFRLAWPLALETALHNRDHHEAKALLAIVADTQPDHVPTYLAAQRSRYAALITVRGGHGAADVEAELRSAIDRLHDLGYPYWLARAQADLAGWLESQQRRVEATLLSDEARETFTRLGVPAE